MSIYGTCFSIEDERQWVAELNKHGINAGVIRDGDPDPEDLDAPLIYQGSHVLPEADHPRGGHVGLACINAFVRHYREHPDSEEEPWLPLEPYLRLDVKADDATAQGGAYATVVLTVEQASRLRAALDEWIALTRAAA